MRNPPVFPPPSASRRSALAWGLFALLCGSLVFPNLVLLHVQPLASAYGAMGLRSGLAGAVLIPIGIWLCLLALFGRCWVVCLLMAPLAACMPLVLYYIMRYGHPLTAEIIAVSADTNAQEILQYFGHSLIWLLAVAVLGGGVALGGAWAGWRSRAGLSSWARRKARRCRFPGKQVRRQAGWRRLQVRAARMRCGYGCAGRAGRPPRRPA